MPSNNTSPSIKFAAVAASLGILAFGGALLAVLWLPNKDERLANLSSMATTAGALIAIVALLVAAVTGVFAAKQLGLNRKVAKHQFLLQFFTMVQKYNQIHIRLRHGDWSNGEGGPQSPEEWNEVGRYLGLLGTIRHLIADGIMDVETADTCYSHRMVYLMRNKAIYQKELVQDRETNPDFVALVQLLENQPVFRLVKSGHNPA
jgi:hypothetical protein